MVRGFYEAASGALSQLRNFNVMANNVANLGTTGYKAETLVGSSFAEHLVARIGGGDISPSRNIGGGSFFTTNITEYYNFDQGSMESTGNELDMAINGPGFFMVSSESLGDVLTRNGQFDVDSEMNLVLPGVGLVLDDGGSPITLESSSILVDQYGMISVGGEEVAQIGVYAVEDMDSLYNAGRGMFQSEEEPDAAPAGTYQVLQNVIEKSNVNMAVEMSRVMAGQNMYNACSQVVKMYDQLNEALVTQIGRVSS
ncbi:MAG: flagellar hook-basal body complex protein [Clostridiales Family XIII bacterium]|jgi:flagellar basal-body rod protein FlgG|nr:flagellar hook-basal body complex protein [Clostridiales Family XIII bacterium]